MPPGSIPSLDPRTPPEFVPDPGNEGGFPLTPEGILQRRAVEAFLLAFDSNLAPIVGQQITLTHLQRMFLRVFTVMLNKQRDTSFLCLERSHYYYDDCIVIDSHKRYISSHDVRRRLYRPSRRPILYPVPVARVLSR